MDCAAVLDGGARRRIAGSVGGPAAYEALLGLSLHGRSLCRFQVGGDAKIGLCPVFFHVEWKPEPGSEVVRLAKNPGYRKEERVRECSCQATHARTTTQSDRVKNQFYGKY